MVAFFLMDLVSDNQWVLHPKISKSFFKHIKL